MTEPAAEVLALRRVAALPLDLADPFYAPYPLLKLGDRESVSFYAERLATLLEAWLGEPGTLDADGTGWVITAPAFHAIPSAANLLCADVHQRLADRLPPARCSTRLDIRHLREDPGAIAASEMAAGGDYSRFGWAERVASRARSDRLAIDDRRFAGRRILFVNDINVTGAQRQGMTAYFRRVEAARVVWASLIEVDEAIGRREPQLENALNTSRQLSIEELAEVLARPTTRFTAKGVARILSMDPLGLARLLVLVGAERRAALRDLVEAEGRYDGPVFAPQRDLVRAACAADGLGIPGG